MSYNFRLPNITATTPEGKLAQMQSFLYQTVEQLNWALNTIETGGGGTGTTSVKAAAGGGKAEDSNDELSSFNAIKALIIKSADIINAYYEEINNLLKLSGEFVAEATFPDGSATFVEKTNLSVAASSKAITQYYSDMQLISGTVDGIKEKMNDVTAHIKSGLLYYNDLNDEDNYIEEIADGAAIYGVEIGEKVSDGVTETFNQFARFVASRLTFYDSNGNKVSWISDKKLHIKNAEITISLIRGGLVDTVLADGSVVTK